jgi:hypothetical protein
MVASAEKADKEVFAADVNHRARLWEQQHPLTAAARNACGRRSGSRTAGSPSRGAVALFFRRPLAALPEGVEARLPIVPDEEAPDGGGNR